MRSSITPTCTSRSSTVATRPAGIGRTRIRSSSSIRRRCSTASRRRCSGPARCSSRVRRRGCRSGPDVPEIQHYYDEILHRRFVGSGRVTFLGGSEYHTDDASAPRHVAGVGRDDPRRRAPPGRRRDLPGADHPRDDTAAVRRRRRRSRRRRQRAGHVGRRAERVRDRRIRQDRHRRHRVVAGERRAARSDRLGPAARAVDAQPRGGPARPRGRPRACRGHHGGGRRGRVARRLFLRLEACRRDAAHRHRPSFRRWPRRRPSAHGSSICSARSSTSFASDTSST